MKGWFKREGRMSTETILELLQCKPVGKLIKTRTLGFLCHVARRSSGTPPWQLMFGSVVPWTQMSSKGKRTRSMVKWHMSVLQELRAPWYDYRIWSRIAQDRDMLSKETIDELTTSSMSINVTKLKKMRQAREKSMMGTMRKCPVACDFKCSQRAKMTEHIMREHPLITQKWKCTCGNKYKSPDAAIRHVFGCVQKGKMQAVAGGRKEWKQARCGRIQETKNIRGKK